MIAFWIELSCDADRCRAGRNHFVAPFDISENLRGRSYSLVALRESEGWTTKDDEHYCPAHSPSKRVAGDLRVPRLRRGGGETPHGQ